MNYCRESEFWWENITGANMVLTNVVSSLENNKNVILNVPEDLPWRREMRSLIELLYRKHSNSDELTIQIIDAKDDCGDSMPGQYLLEKYGRSRAVKTGYRKGSKYTIQDYLVNNGVLKNTVFWIKGFFNQSQEKAWIEFVNGFESSSIQNGQFLLEVHNIDKIYDSKISFIDFSNIVSKYDVQLFISFILEEKKLSPSWKKYISTVVANLCKTDSEIAFELVNSIDFSREEPIEGIKRIVESGEFNSRGSDKNSKHILSLYRNNNTSEINHRIWLSQLQVLFPIIELERTRFIKKYKHAIQRAIDNYTIIQYEKELTSADEMELGTLDHHIHLWHIEIEDSNIQDWISFLHNSRNALAHSDYIDVSAASTIINADPLS